jgi:hypothetical protein
MKQIIVSFFRFLPAHAPHHWSRLFFAIAALPAAPVRAVSCRVWQPIDLKNVMLAGRIEA